MNDTEDVRGHTKRYYLSCIEHTGLPILCKHCMELPLFTANPTGWHHHCACFTDVPAEQLRNLSQVLSDEAEITPGNRTPELAFSH